MLDRDWLIERDFRDFVSISELRESRLQHVPDRPGVYAVLRESTSRPEFLARSPAGHFKGKDPTVSRTEVEARWNERSRILYLGATIRTLKTRLCELLDFGSGQAVGHWGGRIMWQVAGSEELLVGWNTATRDPHGIKAELLLEHEQEAQRMPFANLKH